jgi:hypothetical protein
MIAEVSGWSLINRLRPPVKMGSLHHTNGVDRVTVIGTTIHKQGITMIGNARICVNATAIA